MPAGRQRRDRACVRSPHLVAADLLAQSESYAIWFEGVRRVGVARYLVAIALGLATIIEALRFQAIRLRELPAEPAG